jgi:hypothetical protein
MVEISEVPESGATEVQMYTESAGVLRNFNVARRDYAKPGSDWTGSTPTLRFRQCDGTSLGSERPCRTLMIEKTNFGGRNSTPNSTPSIAWLRHAQIESRTPHSSPRPVGLVMDSTLKGLKLVGEGFISLASILNPYDTYLARL